MRKLILVVLLLAAVLLISWWAKGANFNLSSMIQGFPHTQIASNSALPTTQKVSPTLVPIEILITITPNGFVPDVIMIDVNTKITWVNKSGATANVSSDPANIYPALNLGDVGQNGSTSLLFSKPGRYHYANNKNLTQKGTLVVR